ncbi:uncharacterized protein LOC143468178 [Clavelina lepadiformis]|uniref:E3 ubiquitin-protein ligase PPP1R11 n=1 Tax=Clavelina lepadiformis TaxID=159417 RepID=A0ABP0F8G5_CLALP
MNDFVLVYWDVYCHYIKANKSAANMSATRTVIRNETQSRTETVQEIEASVSLQQPETQSENRVTWSEDTVDNEHLGKKSSKCCCIYKKPHKLGESSSESDISDDETNPYEKIKKKKHKSHKPDCPHGDEKAASSSLAPS